MIDWQNLRQGKGQSVQEYTQEFKKRDLVLGIPLYTQETILKYIGGLHSYLRHMILMFNLTNLDEVCVQATHMESKGKNTKENFSKKPLKPDGNKFKGKGKCKHTTTMKKGENLRAHIARKKVPVHPNVGNFTQNSNLRSFGIRKTRRPMLQQSNMIWDLTLVMELRLFVPEFKVKILLLLFQSMKLLLMKER